jgi:signal transduction histidine kinase/CheY-like chemotaxis protein
MEGPAMSDETNDTPKRRKLLIIDDDPHSLKATSGLLGYAGYDVSGCDSGEAGLAALREDEEISVCVLDQQLNGPLDGMQTLKRLRKEHPHVRAIMFTAAAEEDRGDDARAAGASFYYYKPRLDPSHLVTLVDALIQMGCLEAERNELQSIIDAMGVEVMVRDRDYRVQYINKRKRENWVRRWRDHSPPVELLPGKTFCYDCFEFMCPKDESGRPECVQRCPCQRIFDQDFPKGGIVVEEHEAGDEVILIVAGPIYGADGTVSKAVEVAIDIRLRKQAIQAAGTIQKHSGSPLGEVSRLVVDQVREILGSRVRLYLANASDGFDGVACAGMQSGFAKVFRTIRLPPDDPQATSAFASPFPTLVGSEDIANDPCGKWINFNNVTQKMLVPLRSGYRRVGLLVIDSKDRQRPFTKEDLDLIALLSGAITEALRSSIDQAQHKRHLAHLESLRRIDDKLVEERDRHAICQAVADELTATLGANSAWLLRRDEDIQATPHLITEAVAGDLDPGILQQGHAGNTGLVSACIGDAKIHEADDLDNCESFQQYLATLPSDSPIRDYVARLTSVIVVPIKTGEWVYGVCSVHFGDTVVLRDADHEYMKDVVRRVSMTLAQIDDQQQVEAIAIERAKLSDVGLLGAGVAHSLRNPLATAHAALENVYDYLMTDAKAGRTEAEEAMEAIRDASQLIDQLVRWAKPQGNDPDLFDLREALEDLGSITRVQLEAHDTELKVNISDGAQFVFGPTDAVKMAFVDLIANAVRATGEGGKILIRAKQEANRKMVRIEVEDDGPGLPTEVEHRLFCGHPGAVPAPPGGTGLGLYLAKKVVSSAGGTFAYERPAGGGSRFVVRLPNGQ